MSEQESPGWGALKYIAFLALCGFLYWVGQNGGMR